MKRQIWLVQTNVKVKGACDHQANTISANRILKTTSARPLTMVWQTAVCLLKIKTSWCVSNLEEPYWDIAVHTRTVQNPIWVSTLYWRGECKNSFLGWLYLFFMSSDQTLVILQGVSARSSCTMNTVSWAKSALRQSFQLCKRYFYPITAFRTNL